MHTLKFNPVIVSVVVFVRASLLKLNVLFVS